MSKLATMLPSSNLDTLSSVNTSGGPGCERHCGNASISCCVSSVMSSANGSHSTLRKQKWALLQELLSQAEPLLKKSKKGESQLGTATSALHADRLGNQLPFFPSRSRKMFIST